MCHGTVNVTAISTSLRDPVVSESWYAQVRVIRKFPGTEREEGRLGRTERLISSPTCNCRGLMRSMLISSDTRQWSDV
ncbi:hypothetical protein E2C01_018595 [Portunus trituberculatus]|uniref:Uncharacterized protein n=1 Tax=Portunus trituberculatus TaxID=210409 RepID=A0A5B7DVM6_PORTR|nr:hypothetical protein [Portunus trituberculatus]